MKTVTQFVSFKIRDAQLLDDLKIHGGAASLDSFLKAYKTSGTKGFFPTNGLITLTNCRTQNYPRLTNMWFLAVTLLTPNAQTMLTYYKEARRHINYQIEAFKATTHWDWELSIPATTLKARTNVLIQNFFALVAQQRCCFSNGGSATNGCFLQRQRSRNVKIWWYFA